MNLEDFRTNYSLGRLARKDLSLNPITQFEKWLNEIIATGMKDPTAMVLATVDKQLQVHQRYVLLKGFDEKGFVFFTDTASAKGQEIANHPHLSMLFPWHIFERQVRIQGVATPLNSHEVVSYFRARPKGSQIAALTSQQSQVIESRALLESSYQNNVKQYTNEVPLPERWGGYRVIPSSFEFWQGGEHRLHDRFRYTNENKEWTIDRLQP